MAEYIKKSIAIAIVSDSADMYPFEKNEAIRRIEDSTPAGVAPVVQGRWVYGEDVDIQCSVCGADAFTEGDYRQVKSRYCPNCGAKMDLED